MIRAALVLGLAVAPLLVTGCARRTVGSPAGTLAELRDVEPDVEEAEVEQGLEQAMEGYRRFLEEAPDTAITPEAMRRLADLQLEKEFGIRGGDTAPREMAAPRPGAPLSGTPADPDASDTAGASAPARESEQDFERRASSVGPIPDATGTPAALPDTVGDPDPAGPLEAIALYDRLLEEYPDYEHRDKVLYQKARAFDELGRVDEAIATMEQLIDGSLHSEHYDEVQFRRGEYFFTRRKFRDAEAAYGAILDLGTASSYYELALYKLGWTLYKQEFYEEALHRYTALLDHKVSIGFDFDGTHAESEEDERRVTDTFRVISLSFNNLGGPEAVREYFSEFGERPYEDRVYANLGAHYLEKLRYDDAAETYRTFVALHPFHRSAPEFGMRVVDTFTQGGFPLLVLEAKREFAAAYGLEAPYWRHHAPEELPEVLAYLKANLGDLATFHHARYQEAADEDGEKSTHYLEARRWYGDYLASFPDDVETPSTHYRLADLLLENGDFAEAAYEYERTAYDYPGHEQSAAAGYAAVFSHREGLRTADGDAPESARRETVSSSLRFAETFPEHEHAPAVLGAAADDQYAMSDHEAAVASARQVVERYPDSDLEIRRSAWIVVAHGSFDLAAYPEAESAYTRVLAITPFDDPTHADFVDNLAASIYKQGELANDAGDAETAAGHFLRVRTSAPSSTIRPNAEFDAGAALISIERFSDAADVLESFRTTFPEHELELEATKLIARAHREDGRLSRAAEEYDRIAASADDPALRAEALLAAGELYEQSGSTDGALDAYARYVTDFPEPVELALETRSKIAEIHRTGGDDPSYVAELETIVRIDAEAGVNRTARTRTLAGRSALVLAERLYRDFEAVELRQPFERSLADKQARMDRTVDAMGRLVDYEIADVTSAATYYMGRTYAEFSRALADSERPTDLEPTDMVEYELALEETAFPFEEKAIAMHEENLELLHAGIFNEWTEKSLARLRETVPGRYAKDEISEGFLAEVGRYAYRSPLAVMLAEAAAAEAAAEAEAAEAAAAEAAAAEAADEPVETAHLLPTLGDDTEVDDAP